MRSYCPKVDVVKNIFPKHDTLHCMHLATQYLLLESRKHIVSSYRLFNSN